MTNVYHPAAFKVIAYLKNLVVPSYPKTVPAINTLNVNQAVAVMDSVKIQINVWPVLEAVATKMKNVIPDIVILT